MPAVEKNLGFYADAVIDKGYAAHVNAKDQLPLTNKSGGDLVTGDVGVADTTTNKSFTTTTTAGDLRPVYVVSAAVTGDDVTAVQTIANNDSGWVYKPGAYVPKANVDGAVSIGEYLKTSATAKKFTGTGIVASATNNPPAGAKALALESAAGAGQIAVVLLPPLTDPAVYPQRAEMFHWNSDVLTGNALSVTISSSQPLCYFAFQAAAANADSFAQSFMLKAGAYTLKLIGVTTAGGGKIDWYVDDVVQAAGQDWYSAATAYGVAKTAAITVVGDGRHVLKGVVNGKNGASADYVINLTSLSVYPASDTAETV